MPIKIPADLPAFDVLKKEGVMVMSEHQADLQDIRPLRIALLNLMPKKIQTENQFARLIGATPLQIELSLIRMSDHHSKNATAEHMESFYQPFSEVLECGEKFDGLVITGAPIEHLNFEDVDYWDEIQTVFNWTQTHVHSTFGVCWGGMAMLKHFYGIQKQMLDTKAFGCFRHLNLAPSSHYLRGFSDDCVIPVSRWTEILQRHLDDQSDLVTLLGSADVGPCLVEDKKHRSIYIFNHLEYDSDTLGQEYDRDMASRKDANFPENYFPNDDPTKAPLNRWRSHGFLLYGNWINEIYQTTHYDLNSIGS